MSDENSETLELKSILDQGLTMGELKLEDASEVTAVIQKQDQIKLQEDLTLDVANVPPDSIEPQPVPQTEATIETTTSKKQAPLSDDCNDMRTMISRMRIPEKVKVALFGNAVCRGLLINDPNRMIQQFVLKNAKLTMPELTGFAKNPNLAEAVLRSISDSKVWMKDYQVKYNIVTNPRTPVAVALKWLRFLHHDDVKKIARSKSLSQIVATAAKKKVSEEEEKKNRG